MIKKTSFTALLFFFLGCFFLQAQTKSYTIEGQITGADKITKIYFSEGNFQQAQPGAAKEIAVKGGKYTIKGNLAEPMPVWISLSPNIQQNAIQFIADEGKITLTTPADFNAAKITGSKTQQEMDTFKAQLAKFKRPLEEISQTAQAEYQKGVSADSLNRRFALPFKQAQNQLMIFQQNYIQQNPDSFTSLLLVPELVGANKNFVLADSLLNLLSASVMATPTAKAFKAYVFSQKKTSIGALAPDFTLNTPEGKPLSLASLRGKYVLIDFWASWCGPCRKENPNVVAAYQQFKDKGFTILGVSLDRSKDNWIKAIEADGLVWQQVSDLKYWSSEAAVLYGVQSIPANFLLDPNGKIIARDLRGEDLVNTLKELLR